MKTHTLETAQVDNVANVQADDVHAVIGALGVGPVEMFASSGGAVTALALVAAYPHDVTILVAQEPLLVSVLLDAEAAERAVAEFQDAYSAVVAVGKESTGTLTGRTSLATADLVSWPSKRPCSRATMVASSVASPVMPASPRHSPADCVTSSATATDLGGSHSAPVAGGCPSRRYGRRWKFPGRRRWGPLPALSCAALIPGRHQRSR